jgi:PadR family transcriptional regulator PadR
MYRSQLTSNRIYLDFLGMEFSKDLNAVSVTPLILIVLKREASYGYQIIKQVGALSQGKLKWAEGMLYPVLHRLEKQKLIESYWHIPESGRKRKYYKITPKGIQSLEEHISQWETMDAILRNSWNTDSDITTNEP